ncbi:MAG: NAD(P)H-hydrate dehydratase, partial [Clostridia bacterium]|nr:NAD(P)H-hydrate dehydratase [Clostridia bacterium]
LNSLAKYGVGVLKRKNCTVILTPHLKEFSRLTGKSVEDITSNPQLFAEDFAKEYGVILLLKGADSIITDGVNTFVNQSGTTALAKAGSGDMLSGFMCGTVARGISPLNAVCCSAYTMGISAQISSAQKTDYCATAKDIIKNLHLAVKQLTD